MTHQSLARMINLVQRIIVDLLSLSSQVCSGTIPVRLSSGDTEVISYALLDNGSDARSTKSDCLRFLGLKKDQGSSLIQTVGSNKTIKLTDASSEVYSLNQTILTLNTVFVRPKHKY